MPTANLNKLLVRPRYEFTGISIGFTFLDLPDEVLSVIFAHLTQEDLCRIVVTNWRVFKLVKAILYKRITVYRSSSHYAPKKIAGFNDVDYGIVTYFKETVVSNKNFLKLMNSYTFEPELTESVAMCECGFSDAVMGRIVQVFEGASLSSTEKASYFNKLYGCNFKEHGGSNLITLDIRSRIPTQISVDAHEKALFEEAVEYFKVYESGLRRLVIERCRGNSNMTFAPLVNVRSLHILDSGSFQIDVTELSNLEELVIPRSVEVQGKLPRLSSLTVIYYSHTRTAVYSLLDHLDRGQLRYFCFVQENQEVDMHLSSLESQNGSLEEVYFNGDTTKVPLSIEKLSGRYHSRRYGNDFSREDSMMYLQQTTLFPKLKTIGFERYVYHIHYHDTMREFIPMYDNNGYQHMRSASVVSLTP